MAPCSEPSSGWAIASPSRNVDLSGAGSPLDFNSDVKSADAAVRRINRANGGPTCTRDEHPRKPLSPRQGIARGQKRKQEQQQEEGVSHKKTHRAQPAYCRHCNCTATVKWRSGPDGLKTLCNVCGLLYAKRLRRQQIL
ncbi:tannase and feruloyl esterase [Apiospora phragmitis]|uniref:Tannase and feruloyl esterase n=1 Tax=Apiospora phragmitis TaxID=2905665 RepID=A0ABR1UHW7_9PEZI